LRVVEWDWGGSEAASFLAAKQTGEVAAIRAESLTGVANTYPRPSCQPSTGLMERHATQLTVNEITLRVIPSLADLTNQLAVFD
jgi:hypothetical protein